MANIKKKVKLALDESRLLVLGAQILLGFQFRAFLEPDFALLPRSSQQLRLISLGLMLGTMLLLMWPSSFHEISENGSLTPRLHGFATGCADAGLLPFAIALGIDIYSVVQKVAGYTFGLTAGAATAFTTFFFWYGWELAIRFGEKKEVKMDVDDNKPTPLDDKIDTILTECRVVIPGSQALLGFQLVAVLMDGFDHLPPSSQYLHLLSLALITLSVILLMAPAAYHRIVERGEDSERLWRFARTMLLAGMASLAAGVAAECFVVTRQVTHGIASSAASAGAVLVTYAALWFGFTIYMVRKDASKL